MGGCVDGSGGEQDSGRSEMSRRGVRHQRSMTDDADGQRRGPRRRAEARMSWERSFTTTSPAAATIF